MKDETYYLKVHIKCQGFEVDQHTFESSRIGEPDEIIFYAKDFNVLMDKLKAYFIDDCDFAEETVNNRIK